MTESKRQIEERYGMKDDGKGMNRFKEDPEFIPAECEEEAEAMGLDMSDPEQRSFLRGMLIDDPDMLGDWDRYA